MNKTVLSLSVDKYLDLKPILSSLPDQGDDFDFVLIHCYAHIKNGEIYYEIDKDIYEHIIVYEGKEFYHAVNQYCFEMMKGAILAYPKGKAPFLKLDAYVDPYDDYPMFESQMNDLIIKDNNASFALISDGKDFKAILLDEAYIDIFKK